MGHESGLIEARLDLCLSKASFLETQTANNLFRVPRSMCVRNSLLVNNTRTTQGQILWLKHLLVANKDLEARAELEDASLDGETSP